MLPRHHLRMLLETETPANTRLSILGADVRLAAISRRGFLKVGVPSSLGGHGGELDELFHDSAAVQWLRGLFYPDLLIFRSQRLVVEALVRSDNVALRELLLPDLLDGGMGGASAMECPCLEAAPVGLGWSFTGRLVGVPNLQWHAFSLLLPVQVKDQVEGLLLVRSEENGMSVQPAESQALWQQAGCGTVSFQKVFLRADEWLGDQPLWQTLAATNRALRHGLNTVRSR